MTSTDAFDVITTFTRLPWHDSEFLGWKVAYGSSDEPIVTFDIAFRPSDGIAGRTEIRFHEPRGVSADVDLLAKRLCSDQIASGRCEDAAQSNDTFVKELDARFDLYRGESMNGLFLFALKLIHPGGEVLVVARSFSLAKLES